MSAQAWEPRLSRLEGAFEQVGERLGSMDRHLDRVESKVERLESTLDGNFKSLIGWMLGQTAVVGAVVAVAFALHR